MPRWARIVLGGLLAHALTIAIVGAIAAVDVLLVGPPPTQAGAFQDAARRVGVLIGPTVGTLAVVLLARWAARGSTHPQLDGALVGGVAALFLVPLVLGTAGSWRLAYLGSMALKLAGGWAGGVLAARPRAAAG